MKRFHAPPADAPPHRLLDDAKRGIDGILGRGPSPSHHDAWQPADDDLDQTDLIDPATWSVDVAKTDGDALDRRRELCEFRAQLATDVTLVVIIELDAQHANVRGRQRSVYVADCALRMFRVPGRQRARSRAFWSLFGHGDWFCTSHASSHS
jgi:hypothetical protein